MGFLSNIVNGIKGVGNKITDGIGNITNTLNGYSEWLRGLSNKSGASSGKNSATGGTSGANLGVGAPGTTPTQTQTPSTTPTQTPTPTGTPSTAPSTVPSTAPTQTPAGAPENGTSEAPSPTVTGGTPGTTENSEFSSQYAKDEETGEEHIPTYEEFLMGNTAGYNHIRTETSAFYDEQAKKTLEALDEKKTAADNFATGERDSVYGSLEAQKDEVYKYANEVLGDSIAYNKEAYDAIVKLLGEELEAGKLNASEAKELLLSLAGETRQGVYDTAERQREEAHKNADIYRERANVNARNAYAQNLAGYGANAEVLGRMGITGGGYGDWVNGNAYATQRAEVQAANAEAEGAKREAIYTEDMLKLQADNEYNKQKGQAEFDYLERLYNLDSNYRTGMAEAEQKKAKADKAANDTARDTKFKADTLEREGKAEADRIYRGALYENEADYKAGKLEAEQNRDAGKFQAEMDYVQNIMQNDERIANYMEKLKAGDEEAQRQQKEIFAQLLSGAANGTYGAEEVRILANMFGFDETQVGELVDSAGRYKTETEQRDRTNNFINVLGRVKSGELNGEEAKQLATELGLDETQSSLIASAAEAYADTTAEGQRTAKANTFIALLDAANTGAYKPEQIPEIAAQLGLDINNPDDKRLVDMLTTAATSYADGKSAAETAANTEYMNGVYAELMTAATNGSLDAEAIKAIAGRVGFGSDEIDELVGAATRKSDKDKAAETQATKDRQDQNILNMMAESGDAVGYIQTAIEKGAISQEDGGKYLMSSFKEGVKNGTVDVDAINAALDKKLIEPKDYEALKADYNKGIDTSDNSFKNADGSLISEDDAVELISKAKEDKFITPDTIKALINTYEKLYPDSDYIPVESNVATVEEIKNATKNHVGTSSLTESTEEAVGKIFANGQKAVTDFTSVFTRANGTANTAEEVIEWYKRRSGTMTPEDRDAFIKQFKSQYPRNKYFG